MVKKRPEAEPVTLTGTNYDFNQFLHFLQTDRVGFSLLSGIIKKSAGINLPVTEKNLSLMAGRLFSVLNKYDFTNYHQYHDYVLQNGQDALIELVTRMTTNTTDFFREDAHFNFMNQVIPQMMADKKNAVGSIKQELRIWCAVCSSGQEAYTLAMVVNELMPQFNRWKVKILASDIDVEVLQAAIQGVYTQEEIKNVPKSYLKKYFTVTKEGNDLKYSVVQTLRDMIQFASFNLIQPSYPFKHGFDIVICRNVFIYFDRETTKQVIDQFVHHLNPDGFLFLGHSESGMIKQKDLKPVFHSVFRKSKSGGIL